MSTTPPAGRGLAPAALQALIVLLALLAAMLASARHLDPGTGHAVVASATTLDPHVRPTVPNRQSDFDDLCVRGTRSRVSYS